MFLLNNIHDRDYKSIYPNIKNVIFDLSDDQLRNKKNSSWKRIHKGAIVCVVKRLKSSESTKISKFYRVERKFKTDVPDENGILQHVIVGPVVAKLDPGRDMTAVLNEFGVSNRYLPSNQFSIGFNVADLGEELSSLKVQLTGNREITVGELESAVP